MSSEAKDSKDVAIDIDVLQATMEGSMNRVPLLFRILLAAYCVVVLGDLCAFGIVSYLGLLANT